MQIFFYFTHNTYFPYVQRATIIPRPPSPYSNRIVTPPTSRGFFKIDKFQLVTSAAHKRKHYTRGVAWCCTYIHYTRGVAWCCRQRNNADVDDGGDRVRVVSDGAGGTKLILRDVRTGDAGLYVCIAQNDAGRTACSATLRVGGQSLPCVYSYFNFFCK